MTTLKKLLLRLSIRQNPGVLPLLAAFLGTFLSMQTASAASLTSGTMQIIPNTLNASLVRKTNERVTIGVPLAPCVLTDTKRFRLFDQASTEVAIFAKATLMWPAGKNNCGTQSIRALKVQFVFNATGGTRNYSWNIGARNIARDIAEAPVSEIVTNNSLKAGKKEPRVWGILDPAYLVASGIAPPSAPAGLDVYDAAYFPLQWSRLSSSLNYSTASVADWLFDRVSTNYLQALRTGDPAYYREAYLSHEWYISKMEVTGKNNNYCLGGFNVSGKADPSGGCDTKYIYLEGYKLHLALTGDDSWQPSENGTPTASGFMSSRNAAWKTIARLLVTGDVRGGSAANRPALPANGFIQRYTSLGMFWTERDLGFGLQILVNSCELTLDSTVCGWADTVVDNIRQMQIANPDGIRHYGYLSHSLLAHEGFQIPWIGTTASAYTAARSIKLNNVLGQGYQTLTAGKSVRIGSTKYTLSANAVKNADGTWTLPLATAVTVSAGTQVLAGSPANSTSQDYNHATDRIFSPWMQAIAADAVWQYYNWTTNSTNKAEAAAILLGLGRAYAAYALDATVLNTTTKALVEGAFDDYGPLKIFDSNLTEISCSSLTRAPFTRYIANSLMASPDMNARYASFVLEDGYHANEHIPEGIFQLALGMLFETDASKRAAMNAVIQDMRSWYAGYSCSAALSTKRGYNWTNKADPFGTYLYVTNVLSGTTPPPVTPPPVTPPPVTPPPTTPPPTTPAGSWVMTATGTCKEGQIWHHQCSRQWIPAADITAQSIVATCKVTNGTTCANTGLNRYWMKAANLQPSSYLMTCSKKPTLLTSRDGCYGNGAVVSYVHPSTTPTTPPPTTPPPTTPTGLSGWVMSATGTCKEGQIWHHQCTRTWIPAANITAQSIIATCKVSNGTSCANTGHNRYWMKAANFQPSTYVMTCNKKPTLLTSRDGCYGNGAVVSYVHPGS
jgi:hypothetical protein